VRRYTADLHVHTRASPDGLDPPERVVAAARRAGLDAVCITDHDRDAGYRRLVSLGLADPGGAPVDGLLVMPGVEVSCVEGHLLVIGAAFEVGPGVRAAEVVARAHALGALVVAPHAFDRCRHGLGRAVCDRLALDAVETCNSRTLDRASNRSAAAYARDRGLPCVAGSDAHCARQVGRAHCLIEAEDLTTHSLLSAISAGRSSPVEGLHTWPELAGALVRGWLTRPWMIDLAVRSARSMVRRWSSACPPGDPADVAERPRPGLARTGLPAGTPV
jgi:predicted metal-dependent phosphoesterase TrpH